MAKRPNPLVPLEIFRSRAFSSINLATFFIYGGLYVTFFYQAVVLQGVLGYTALGAGLVGLPGGLMLALLSTRIGTVAGRIGSRRFLIAGPLLMAAGLVWFSRLPLHSAPWRAAIENPASLVPPVDALTDILPYTILFGLGISCVVAPLTSTLMGSISGRFSGIGSAINNSISRVGQPLLGAIIFIAISAIYYASLGSLAGVDTSDPAVRHAFQPLNPPAPARPRPRSRPRTRPRSTRSTSRCWSVPDCSSSGRWCRGSGCARAPARPCRLARPRQNRRRRRPDPRDAAIALTR